MMVRDLNLTKASSSLFSGVSAINNNLEELTVKRVPEIRVALAKLDSSQPTYHLRLKTISELFKEVRQDTQKVASLISSTTTNLQESSVDLRWLEQEVRLMELEHEMAVAGRLEKVYLKVSRAVNGVVSSLVSSSNFFK